MKDTKSPLRSTSISRKKHIFINKNGERTFTSFLSTILILTIFTFFCGHLLISATDSRSDSTSSSSAQKLDVLENPILLKYEKSRNTEHLKLVSSMTTTIEFLKNSSVALDKDTVSENNEIVTSEITTMANSNEQVETIENQEHQTTDELPQNLGNSNVTSSPVEQNTDFVIPTDNTVPIYDIDLAPEYQIYAYEVCQQYGLNYELFLSIMFIESTFNFNAVSGSNYGAFQINSCHFSTLEKTLNITNILDPKSNILAGAYVLSQAFENWKDEPNLTQQQIFLASCNEYNMGAGGYTSFLRDSVPGQATHLEWHYGVYVMNGLHLLQTTGSIDSSCKTSTPLF